MTHRQIASAIRNHITDGLSGKIADEEISIEQLMDEIDLARSAIVEADALTMKVDYKYLVQSISSIPVHCMAMNGDCAVYVPGDNIPSIEIPKVMPIAGDKAVEYIGTNDMAVSFDVYFHPSDIRDHKIRIMSRHRPFAWVDLASVTNKETMTVWFFNWGAYNPLKFIKFRGVLDKPGQAISDYSVDTTEYPANSALQKKIITTITKEYINYYRALNLAPAPNTQTDTTIPVATAQPQQ